MSETSSRILIAITVVIAIVVLFSMKDRNDKTEARVRTFCHEHPDLVPDEVCREIQRIQGQNPEKCDKVLETEKAFLKQECLK
ncbi:MAG: hypothetical protein RBS96_02285 [Dehalococcoidales bacterium]|nr:hypothetical protein [Dehalococcoidales bacterium]